MKTDPTRPPAAGSAAIGSERQLRGLGVSAGIAIGPAHVVEAGAIQVPEFTIDMDRVETEVARFQAAVDKATRQLRKLKSKDVGFLLDAHLAMVSGSRLTRGVERRIREDRLNAEAAVQAEIGAIAQVFARMDDSYLAARVADVREVGRRLIRNLMERSYQAFSLLPEGCIVLAEELTPADTALLDPLRIAGFATLLGGAEGHTAIMARSLGMPAVLGVAGLLQGARTGEMVIVDGFAGRVFLNPSPAILEEYRRRREAWLAERRHLKTLGELPSVTRDGSAVTLQANLELPREVEAAMEAGAAGIGLLRTEFMFMNRDTLPSEDEQYESLRTLVERMDGKPVTARTLDVDGAAPALLRGGEPGLGAAGHPSGLA